MAVMANEGCYQNVSVAVVAIAMARTLVSTIAVRHPATAARVGVRSPEKVTAEAEKAPTAAANRRIVPLRTVRLQILPDQIAACQRPVVPRAVVPCQSAAPSPQTVATMSTIPPASLDALAADKWFGISQSQVAVASQQAVASQPAVMPLRAAVLNITSKTLGAMGKS